MNTKPHILFFDLVTTVGGVQSVQYGLWEGLVDRFRISDIDGYQNEMHRQRSRECGVEWNALGTKPGHSLVGGGGSRLRRAIAISRRLPWLLLTAWRLRRWIRAHRPDVVYFSQYQAARWFSPFCPADIPRIYHEHGCASAHEIPRGFIRRLRTFTRILAVSKLTANEMVKAGVSHPPIQVVHNSIDLDHIRAASEHLDDALPVHPEGAILVLLPAAIVPLKQHDVAIRALARLPKQVHLWFAGECIEANHVYRHTLDDLLQQTQLHDRVHFLGWRSDLPAVLRESDIVILPSSTESFGLVLVEGMLLRKPCVGSRIGGIPEVIADGETGLLCEPGSAESLSDALNILIENPDTRRAMGAAGAQRAAKHFSRQRHVREVSSLIESCLDKSRTRQE